MKGRSLVLVVALLVVVLAGLTTWLSGEAVVSLVLKLVLPP